MRASTSFVHYVFTSSTHFIITGSSARKFLNRPIGQSDLLRSGRYAFRHRGGSNRRNTLVFVELLRKYRGTIVSHLHRPHRRVTPGNDNQEGCRSRFSAQNTRGRPFETASYKQTGSSSSLPTPQQFNKSTSPLFLLLLRQIEFQAQLP